MDQSEYLNAIRRRWWVLALAALVAFAVVLATTPTDAERERENRSFAASHSIALIPTGGLATTNATRAQTLATAARLFRGPETARRVAAALGGRNDPEQLAARVGISVNKKRGIIVFATRGRDRAQVARLVDTFAEEAMAFQLELDEETYQSRVERTDERVEMLTAQLNEVDAQIAGNSENASLRATREGLAAQLTAVIGQRAELAALGPPTASFTSVAEAKPVVESQATKDEGFGPPDSRRGRLLLAVALALILAAATVVVLDRFDTHLRSKIAGEYAFGLPVVAEVPLLPIRRRRRWTVETDANPLSPVAEAYRMLRSTILLSQAVPRLRPSPTTVARDGGGSNGGEAVPGDHAYELRFEPLSSPGKDIKVIVVTSPGPGEGKSTTVANLAASFAEVGRSVLVIDCDLRQPTLDRFLEVEPISGMSDVLVDAERSYRLTDVAHPTFLPRVRLVPSGTPVANPARLMTEAREVLLRCRAAADVVIVDTPAALVVNDAAELVPAADAVVVVARVGKTTADAARRMGELLARLGSPVFGVTLIGVPCRRRRLFAGRSQRTRRGATRRPTVAPDPVLEPAGSLPAGFPVHPPPEEPALDLVDEEMEDVMVPSAGRTRRLRPFRRER